MYINYNIIAAQPTPGTNNIQKQHKRSGFAEGHVPVVDKKNIPAEDHCVVAE